MNKLNLYAQASGIARTWRREWHQARGRLAQAWRQSEGGSIDGGSYADVVYLPFLLALLLLGLFFALVGFWRVGASYSTQTSAQVGAVSPGNGGNVLTTWWSGWTGGNFPSGGFALDTSGRAVRSNVETAKTFDFFGFGEWEVPIGGQTSSRSERFYPGRPVCDENGCHE